MGMNLIPWGKRSDKAVVGHPINNLRQEMDRLFEDFLGDWPLLRSGGEPTFAPRLNVAESDTEFTVTTELPGMTEKDVEVSLSEGRLSISGEKKTEKEEKEKSYHLVERSYGKFSRLLDLGASVDAAKVAAVFKDGVLTVTVPKTEAAKPKKIDISTR